MGVCFDEARLRRTRLLTAVRLKAAGCARSRATKWIRWRRDGERSWTADALCRLDADCVPVSISEQEIDPDIAFCGGRALAAAVALHSSEILAGAPESAAQYSPDP